MYQCAGSTSRGFRCTRMIKTGINCSYHKRRTLTVSDGVEKTPLARCKGTTTKGKQCRRMVKDDYCGIHISKRPNWTPVYIGEPSLEDKEDRSRPTDKRLLRKVMEDFTDNSFMCFRNFAYFYSIEKGLHYTLKERTNCDHYFLLMCSKCGNDENVLNRSSEDDLYTRCNKCEGNRPSKKKYTCIKPKMVKRVVRTLLQSGLTYLPKFDKNGVSNYGDRKDISEIHEAIKDRNHECYRIRQKINGK